MAIDLGIDLGTANTLVYEKKQGITLNEPSMVVRSRKNGQVLAIGSEASEMMGKNSGWSSAYQTNTKRCYNKLSGNGCFT